MVGDADSDNNDPRARLVQELPASCVPASGRRFCSRGAGPLPSDPAGLPGSRLIPELGLLGGAALIAADGALVSGAAAQPRRVAVLAVLADAWPSAVTRDRVVGLIWPDQSDSGARRLLTQALYVLRRELGDFARVSGQDLAINADALRIDLIEFRRALRGGELERAAALYRGPALDGFHLRGALEFERWAEALRDESRRQFQGAVEALAGRHEADGSAREAARWWGRLVQAAPFDAGAVLRLMDAWERTGDRGAALAAAGAYERRMREELELDPDAAVRRRAEEIRAAKPTPPGPDDPVSSVDVAPIYRRVTVAGHAPGTAAESPPRGTAAAGRRRVPLLAAVAAALTATVLGAVAVLRRAPEPPAERRVLVLPFEVRGDAGAAPSLGVTLATVLTANLDGAGGARVERVTGAPGDTPAPLEFDRAASIPSPRGAWAILSGGIVATGDQLRLDAELRPLSAGVRPLNVVAVGPRDSLIALADRLSMDLVAAFYPELGAVTDRAVLRSATRVPALRRYLDGEAAWRRGAFEAAHAAFGAAAELDSAFAYAWYRRAVAAEWTQRSMDADRSIAAAEAHDALLSERQRLLLRGYAAWRGGDAPRAEAIYRRLVRNDRQDGEAWFHLAEIAYHAGPLHGRALDAARDPWRQVVALDSGNFPALTHAIRLEARARDTTAIASLLRRIADVRAEGPVAVESRVIAAYGLGDPDSIAAVLPAMDTLPDYSRYFLHAVVAGFLEQPAAARSIARRMTAPSRPDAVRAQGRIALAHLALAEGRWREAWTELDRASSLDPVATAWARAYFAALPFLQVPGATLDSAARSLAAAPRAPTAAPLYLELAVEAPAAPVIERYLAELLRLAGPSVHPEARRAGAPGPAGSRERAACDVAGPASTEELCRDLRLGLSAEAARRAGRTADALLGLEALGMRVPYQFAGRSVFFARTRERFLRAQLLEEAGRLADAYTWYEAVPHGARFDYIFLAPTHLGRGRIRERLGDRAGAAAHYRRVLELWPEPDPELAALRREAAEGLRRVAPPR